MKISLIDPLEVSDEYIKKQEEKIKSLGHDFEYFKESAKDDEEKIKRLEEQEKKSDNKKTEKNIISIEIC